jgi:RimJ/RimL family protein N-acetyltransferase
VTAVPFEGQPTIRGDMVSIRPLSSDDFTLLFEVAKDPSIWEQHAARDRYKEPVFRLFFDQALKSGGALVVFDIHNGRAIGSSRFAEWNTERSEVEIGWTFLARSHWGGKYNSELKRLMLQHAFRFVDSVLFNVGVQNIRSQRAVLKLGATEEARPVNRDGLVHVRFRLTRGAYATKGQASQGACCDA